MNRDEAAKIKGHYHNVLASRLLAATYRAFGHAQKTLFDRVTGDWGRLEEGRNH
jgi:hypothetical protein